MTPPPEYPPVSYRIDQIEALLDVMCSVLQETNAVYLSVPLTSGRRMIDWKKSATQLPSPSSPEYSSELKRLVIDPNREHVRELVKQLRRDHNEPIINPSAVGDLIGWNQSDYRFFWGRVIERFAAKVLLVEGWQYSNGCTYEFLVAGRHDRPACDESGSPISVNEGKKLIRLSISEMTECGLPTDFLESVIADLVKLAARGGEVDAEEKDYR